MAGAVASRHLEIGPSVTLHQRQCALAPRDFGNASERRRQLPQRAGLRSHAPPQRGTVVALDTVQRRLRLLDRPAQRVATVGIRGRQALDLVHRAGL